MMESKGLFGHDVVGRRQKRDMVMRMKGLIVVGMRRGL